MKVALTNVRIAFPKLFTAEAVGKGDGKYYSAAFPIEPGSANHKALDAAIAAVSKEKWGAKADAILGNIIEKGDIGFKHKPAKNATGEVYEGFEGMFTCNASLNEKKGRPLIIDGQKNPLTERDGKPYGGCYVNASVDVWAQDNANGKRVNVQLKGIQFARDGDAFTGGSPASVDDFDEISEGATADDLA